MPATSRSTIALHAGKKKERGNGNVVKHQQKKKRPRRKKKKKAKQQREESVEQKATTPKSTNSPSFCSADEKKMEAPRVSGLEFSLLELELPSTAAPPEKLVWRSAKESKRKKKPSDRRGDKKVVVSWPQKSQEQREEQRQDRRERGRAPASNTQNKENTSSRNSASSSAGGQGGARRHPSHREGRTRPPIPHKRSKANLPLFRRGESPASSHSSPAPSPRHVGSYSPSSQNFSRRNRRRDKRSSERQVYAYVPKNSPDVYPASSPSSQFTEPTRESRPRRRGSSRSRSPSFESRREMSSSSSSRPKYSSSPPRSSPPPVLATPSDADSVSVVLSDLFSHGDDEEEDHPDTTDKGSSTKEEEAHEQPEHQLSVEPPAKDKHTMKSNSYLCPAPFGNASSMMGPSPSASPSTSPCVSPEILCIPTFLGFTPFTDDQGYHQPVYHGGYYAHPYQDYMAYQYHHGAYYHHVPAHGVQPQHGGHQQQPQHHHHHHHHRHHKHSSPAVQPEEQHHRPSENTGHDIVRRPPQFRFAHLLNDTDLDCISRYCNNVFSAPLLKKWFDTIHDKAIWSAHETYNPRFGNSLPRLVAWYTNHPCTCEYKYSGVTCESHDTPDWLQQIQSVVFQSAQITVSHLPDSCNINLYRNGYDCAGWHRDDEELFDSVDKHCLIVSFSLGASRMFEFRRTYPRAKVTRQLLSDGDVLTMEGRFQRYYQHRVPADNSDGSRINLTWRWIQKHSSDCPKSAKADK